MRKLSKKSLLLIVILLVISLSVVMLYSTYATGEGVTPDETFTFNLNDSTTTTVEANSSKLVYYQIKNTNPGTVRYGVGYSSTSSTVYVYSDSDDEASDLINRDDTKIIKLRIENTGNSTDTVEISTVYGYVNGGNLIPPSGVTLVTEKIYTLKFNANGGNINTPSKLVKLNEPYGTLPTPTRDGYTFLGWNGKNLLDVSKITSVVSNSIISITDTGFDYTRRASTNYDLFVASIKFNLKPNTMYSLFFEKNNKQMIYAYRDQLFGEQLTRYNDYNADIYNYKARFITDNSGNVVIGFYSVNENADSNGNFSNIIMMEGYQPFSILQEYEPYYVTSSTIVTERNTDYVLTAIWEENNNS